MVARYRLSAPFDVTLTNPKDDVTKMIVNWMPSQVVSTESKYATEGITYKIYVKTN